MLVTMSMCTLSFPLQIPISPNSFALIKLSKICANTTFSLRLEKSKSLLFCGRPVHLAMALKHMDIVDFDLYPVRILTFNILFGFMIVHEQRVRY